MTLLLVLVLVVLVVLLTLVLMLVLQLLLLRQRAVWRNSACVRLRSTEVEEARALSV